MQIDQNEAYKNFLTVVFEYYNHFNSKMTEKKIKLYSEEWKGREKQTFFPPTIWDIFAQENWIQIQKKEFLKWFGEFLIMEPSDEVKELKKKDIARQDKVMSVIKLRNEKFNYNCWLIKAGTWVGKSILTIKITQYFECNTLILVPNTKLLWELHDRFLEFTWLDVWIYGGWKKEIEPITICTKKSFSLDFDKIADPKNHFETLIIDECHEWFSDALRMAINKSFRQVNLFGMSATPFTPFLEEKDLEKYFGKVIDVKDWYDYTPDFEIINYKPWKIRIQWKESSEYIFEDYPELRSLLAEDEVRFDFQMEKLKQLYKERNAIIVLTDRVLESNNFYDRLAKWDTTKFNLIKITWETNPIDDENAVKEAKMNWLKTIIVWSIKKIGTGFDFPPGDTIFLVSAIKWKSTTEQAIWRILRKYDKLNPLVVIWNDDVLRWQKMEKEKTIKKVYWVDKKSIKFFEIWDQRPAHEKMTLDFTDITKWQSK